MSLLRFLGIFGLLFAIAAPATAQFIPQPVPYPVPVYYPVAPPSGVGIYNQTGRLRIAGFFGAPLFTPYTTVNNSVTYSFAGPTTYVVRPRLVAVEDFYNDVDIAGVDLDAKPLTRKPPIGIAGRVAEEPAPVVAKVQPKADVVEQPKVEPAQIPAIPDLPPPADNVVEENARLIELGRVAFRERMYGLAELRFSQAVKVAPFEPYGYFMLSQAQFALGRYRDATQTIFTGMRRHADWPGAGYQLRNDLFKGADDNLKGFMKLLEETSARNPGQPAYDFLLAHQLWFDGQRDAARVIFRRLRPTAPEPELIDAFLKSGNQVAAQ